MAYIIGYIFGLIGAVLGTIKIISIIINSIKKNKEK